MNSLNFKKLTTSGGIPLYAMSLPYAQSVAAGVLVKVGSRDEVWPKQAGLAHALEHMVFQGTKMFKDSKAASAYLEEVGGYANAFTSKEGTFFFCHLPADYKNRAVIFLNELVNNCTIPEHKIKIEMNNIAEEIKMWNDNPTKFLQLYSFKHLFQSHPLGRSGLGMKEVVLSFKKEDFENFLNSYYHNQNFAIVVAGKITPLEAKRLFDNHFSNHRQGKKISRQKILLENYSRRKFIKSRADIQQIQLILASPTAPAKTKDSLALEVFASMVDGGMSFPLFQELRDKRGLCYHTEVMTERYSDLGFWGIYIGTDPQKYQEAIRTAIEVIQDNKANEELRQKAADLILGRISLTFENPSKIINSAATDIIYGEEPKGYKEIKQEIESITIKQIKKSVETYLKPKELRQILLVPENLK